MKEWDEWKEKQEAKIRANQPLPKEKPKRSKGPLPRRLITEQELARLAKLQKVTFAPASGDKRFIQQFKDVNQDWHITEGQGDYIDILWYKYRKQIGHHDPMPEGYQGRTKK